MAVFIGATAVAMQGVGLVGRPTMYVGAMAGVAGVVLAIWGIADPNNANPIALLFGMLWLLVANVRLVVRPGTHAESLEAAAEHVPVAA
jgi:hypothetical protein